MSTKLICETQDLLFTTQIHLEKAMTNQSAQFRQKNKKNKNDRFNKFCLIVVKKFHHVQRLFVKIGSAKEIENVDRKWEEHKVKHFKRRKNAQSIISTMLIANAKCGLFKRL